MECELEKKSVKTLIGLFHPFYTRNINELTKNFLVYNIYTNPINTFKIVNLII